MIVFFNTLGRRLEEFRPLRDMEVRIYTCGPTVWNYPHIGNYRTFMFDDLLRRFLQYRGFKVVQVMNVTDVDDRIIKVCREQNSELHEFTEKYSKAFFEDLDFLGIERAEYYPKATDNIHEMVGIVEGLLEKRFAYRGDDGSVYFSISKFPDYGKLSSLKVSNLKPGARVRQDDYAKDAAEDFALWKAWEENDGKISWDTTLGRGRPGWHIECSAMSMKYLSEQFDIHTGGVDNIFPHHENEIAQSEAFTGKKFVNYWLHSEHLLVNGQKMAKRLGNFITIKDLRDKNYEGRSIRLLLLSGHYRDQLNFSAALIEQARSSLKRINDFHSRLLESTTDSGDRDKTGGPVVTADAALALVNKTRDSYVRSLESDLDTPRALATVFEFITEGNKILDEAKATGQGVRAMLDFMENDFDSIFGVLQTTSVSEVELTPNVMDLLKQREEARRAKNWKLSDELRTTLASAGIEVQDTPQGQKWRKRIGVVD